MSLYIQFEILALFATATGMEINADKSNLSIHRLGAEETGHVINIFHFHREDLDGGLKYNIVACMGKN